jgi:formylglycine-generating enzyme
VRDKHFSLRHHFLALCGRVSQPNRACLLHIFAVSSLLSFVSQSFAGMVTFGSGGNQFQMEFVTIGSPGNAADTTGAPNPAGSVGYVYGIGTYEVSEVMIDKYNASQPGGVLQITKDTRGPNKPATSVSWNEAARFVNWLNTSTGGFAAYKFDLTSTGVNDDIIQWAISDAADYDPSNPLRSKRAKYVLPSMDEWYKAAYFNPSNNSYYDYTTGSNTAPTSVASGDGTGVNGNNEVVYQGQAGPADVNQAGGLSAFGVMGLGGNVWEWEESFFDSINRGVRGSYWDGFAFYSSAMSRGYGNPSDESYAFGFRVATLTPPAAVPEPSTMAIFGLGALSMAYRARRKSKA